MLFPSPEELEALARRLDGQAEDLAQEVRGYERDVHAVRWQSAGADRYRADCAVLTGQLRGNESALREAADDLRRHARQVRERVAWMHQMYASLRREAEEAWGSVEHTADEVFEWGEEQARDAWATVKSWL